MTKKGLKGFPVGEQLYIFCTGSSPQPSVTKDLVISAHGGFSKSSENIRLPHWVRGLYLYAPHGAVLSDPGIETLATNIQAFEVKRPGDVVVDYGLSKYQGKHNKGDETYETVMRDVGRRAIDVANQRANPGALNRMMGLTNRITGLTKDLAAKKREKQDLVTALKNPPPASDPGAEDFRAVTQARLEAIEQEAAEMQQHLRSENARYKQQVDTGRDSFIRGATSLDSRRTASTAVDSSEGEVLQLFDVLTVRNRRFRGEMTLKRVLLQLHAAGLMYPRIHCSFCRSPVDQPDSHDISWAPGWNAEIKR